ncbi:1053_t:CDS:2 [Paraglomus brasilianum]|uniref:1053_t:CDS:1 n=1 Tax=Paraglomus brasilianum TaxID=144538 RepID=A0A9N9D067_9GLOM|nr:1053_t:CDS:2 [Paraglomus brasilianum]
MTQLLKKDVSPKHATPNVADSHRPDSVYRPNPFPINPIVGYPSAPVTTYHYPPHADSNYDDNGPPPQYSSYDTNSSYPHSHTYGRPSDGYDTSTVTYPPIGALGFIAGASSVSHVSTPPDIRPGVIGLYVVSITSCLVSLFYVCKYFSRRFGRNRKLRRWIMLLIDFVLAFAWGILGYFLIVKFKCPPGDHNGW